MHTQRARPRTTPGARWTSAWRLLLLFQLLGGAPAPRAYASGAIYYLSPHGHDGGPGTLAAPWRTPSYAAARVTAGDTVVLRGGEYRGAVELHASGLQGRPITFTAYPGETATLTRSADGPGQDLDTVRVYGSYVTLRHLRVTDENTPGQAIWVAYNARYVTITACEVFGAHGQGILLSGDHSLVVNSSIHGNGVAIHRNFDHGIYVESAYNTISHNRIYGNATYGVVLYRGDPGVRGHNVVEYNLIYDNGRVARRAAPDADSAGIGVAYQQPMNRVYFNVICGNAKHGIYLLDQQAANLIADNVTCFNGTDGIAFRYAGPSSVLRGNISYADHGPAISGYTGARSDFNTFFDPGGQPTFAWNEVRYTGLQAFQAASGQDLRSAVRDPHFAHPPLGAFDPAQAARYSFCTRLLPQLC